MIVDIIIIYTATRAQIQVNQGVKGRGDFEHAL